VTVLAVVTVWPMAHTVLMCTVALTGLALPQDIPLFYV
jgi:hypothetical protein